MFQNNIKYFVDVIFSLGLFFNAALFIPQAVRLYKKKNSEDVSLLTFAGFNVMQLFTTLHGYFVKDYLLMSGFLLSFLTCGTVTVLTFKYRAAIKN